MNDKTPDDLSDEIWELKEKRGTWEAVAAYYDSSLTVITRTVVWRIAKEGYEPKNNEARRLLGLDELIMVRASRAADGTFQKRSN